MMQIEYFATYLTDRLEPEGTDLPICNSAVADLLALMPDEDDYIYLALKGDSHYEVVRAYNAGGTILIERAQEGTTAVLHHYGTCVSAVSPLVAAVMKDLICNYTCCEEECPCDPVAFGGASLPDLQEGVAWEGAVVFSGDLPMTIGISNAPGWMEATTSNNIIKLSGTPTSSEAVHFSVAATNCNGTHIVTESLTINAKQLP